MIQRTLTLLGLGVALAIPAHAAPAKPNILFILTDDQGYGDWSTNGHPLLKTPHVDKLAAESVRLENFYVSPSCSPTRAALMTGMHEFRNGVTHTQVPREKLWNGATVLPQLLATAGYRNGFIGKWHLGNAGEYNPANRGFDWGSTNQGGPRSLFDPTMIRNGEPSQGSGYREDIFFDDAMQFISETKDQPWFLYLATYSPHTDLGAPEDFVAPFRGKVTEKQAKYLGMVANLDYASLSPEEYLERERQSPSKHEYVRGQIYAMAGASRAHSLIVLNLATQLRNHLRGSGCIPYTQDMKVRLETANTYFYPDLVVSCDERDRESLTQDFISYPCLVVEVLSPTTAAFDRGDKFADYRSLETLQEYVLISQERMAIDCFRRNCEGLWVLYPYEKGDDIYLSSLDFRCAIASLYEDVTGIG